MNNLGDRTSYIGNVGKDCTCAEGCRRMQNDDGSFCGGDCFCGGIQKDAKGLQKDANGLQKDADGLQKDAEGLQRVAEGCRMMMDPSVMAIAFVVACL